MTNNMQKIKIFLASSLDELREQRNELARFVLGINNHLISQNIYIELELCEELNPAFVLSRKQEEYNNYIRNADYVFFLFLTKVGTYTREEFEVAYQHFQEYQKPHILTYFYHDPATDASSESHKFAEELSERYGHYYCICNNVETIKLALLLQISNCFSNLQNVTLKEGHVYLDDVDYLAFDETDIISGNLEYQQVIQKLNLLEQQLEQYARTPDEKREEIISCKIDREMLLQQKQNIEDQSLKYMRKIYEDILHGSISEFKARLYHLIEQGKLNEADNLLQLSTLDNFSNNHQQLQMQQHEMAKECIELYEQKISLTEMQMLAPQRIDLISECYRKIREIVEMSGKFENALIPYIHFLVKTDGDLKEIESVIAYIQWNQMKPGAQIPFKDYCDLYNELLDFYLSKRSGRQFQETLSQYIERIENATEADPDALFDACIKIQFYLTDLDTKRQWLEKALNYATENNSDYQTAIYYKEMGCLEGISENFEKSESCFQKSLTCMEALYNADPEKWIQETVQVYLVAGNIYMNKACDLIEQTNDVVSFLTNDGTLKLNDQNWDQRFSNWKQNAQKAQTWKQMATPYYFAAYILIEYHLKTYDTFANRQILCQCLTGLGIYYEEEQNISKASDAYWDYVNLLLEIYEEAPYQVVNEILEGFVRPIRVWIRFHVWGDAQFALENYESIANTFYEKNPVKYREYVQYASTLNNEFLDEKEWDF